MKKELTAVEYAKLCKRTLKFLGSHELNFKHMMLGIITETGEIADIAKRKIAYEKEIDIVNLKEEIGDISWYVFNLIGIEYPLFNFDEIDYYIFNTCFLEEEEIKNIEDYIIDFIDFELSNNDAKGIIEDLIKLSSYCGINYKECLWLNIEKLSKRYPEKYEDHLALNRNLEQERKSLEQ